MTHLAIFDFDNTIITKDSLFDFLWYSSPTPDFILKIAQETPSLISHKIGQLSAHHAKERLLARFFKGYSLQRLSQIMSEYSRNRIPKILNQSVYDRIIWHRRHDHHLLIASASIDEWIRPWAESEGFHHVIATKLAFREGIFSGQFEGLNCSGIEKVRRMEQILPDLTQTYIYVYSDNTSDRPLFELAHEPYSIGKSGTMISQRK